MWAVHVSNPFTAKSRDAARDRVVIEKHLEEREQREATRRAGYLAEKRMEQNFQKLSTTDQVGSSLHGLYRVLTTALQAAKKQKNLAERAKYQFEADSEDDEMEDEIDNNLDALSGVTGRLNALAKATGSEIEQQNKDLERIMEKVSLRASLTNVPMLMLYYRETRSTWALLRTEQGWTAFDKGGIRTPSSLLSKNRYWAYNRAWILALVAPSRLEDSVYTALPCQLLKLHALASTTVLIRAPLLFRSYV